MLSVNLPLLKQKLNQLIAVPPIKESVMYKAAYNAYYNVTKTEMNGNNDDPDLAPTLAQAKTDCEKKQKEDAEKFAKEFCNSLKDGGFMDTIADEINSHIKSAQIDITVPALLPTIISPVGPCTGSLSISTMTGAQITIS